MTVLDRFETRRTADFFDEVVGPLVESGVRVDNVKHDEAAGELRADIHLPTRDAALRAHCLELLSEFEEAHGFTVAVLPAVLYPEDEADG